ncbi:MAG: PPC domain-containing protein [Planctomycetaceae bacterium]
MNATRSRHIAGTGTSQKSSGRSRSRGLGVLSVLAVLVSCVSRASADDPAAPQITRVFPPGAQIGTTVAVELKGKPGTLPVSAWSSSEAVDCQVSEDGTSANIAVSETASPGLCWLRFHNTAGAASLLPFVIGTAPETTETEPNDRVAESGSCYTGSVVINGVLSKTDDVDCAAVQLTSGQILVAALQAHRDLGSPMDAVLQILGPDGRVLEQNDDDHGFDPQITFTAPADGTYFVRLFAFPATPNSTIRFAGGEDFVYRLTLATDAFVDHSLPLAVTTGVESDVLLHGWNLSADARVTKAAATGDETSLNIATSAAGSTSVDVMDYPTFTEPQLPATMTIPFAVSGSVNAPGQVDVVSFTGNKSQQIALSVVARAKFSLLDPVLELKTADGTVIKDADDISKENQDVQVTVTLPDDGEYRIEIADRFDHGGERFFYLLTCTEPKPEFVLSVAADHFEIAPGKPLEVPVSIERRGGFAGTVRITADQLPEGITFESAESLPEGDSSKSVTIRLASTLPAGHSGVFTVQGETVTGDENSTDAAMPAARVAAVAGGRSGTSKLWLTALANPEPAPVAEPPAADPPASSEE